jgi:hypothetical protein
LGPINQKPSTKKDEVERLVTVVQLVRHLAFVDRHDRGRIDPKDESPRVLCKEPSV